MKRIVTVACFLLAGTMINAQNKSATTSKKPATKKDVVDIKGKKPVSNEKSYVLISTSFGDMIVKLYDSTPVHRDNFLKNVDAGFYDSLLFHRVMPQFMIQGGDPTSKNAPEGALLGGGGDKNDRIGPEFVAGYYHKKGALAAARDNNPDKKSSRQQFYLVDGRTYTDDDLNKIEQRFSIKFSDEQRNMYKTVGGSPFLDRNYTVFGELVSGFDVLAAIANEPRDNNNRPFTDIRMTVKRTDYKEEPAPKN